MINWKIRFKNKTFLITFIPAVLALIYNVLASIGIVPSITQDALSELLITLVNILVMLGIVADPTTEGFCDKNSTH